MTRDALALADRRPDLDTILAAVTARVTPSWPLDRSIAVNPLWGFVERPRHEVCQQLGAWTGARTTLPRAWYRAALQQARFEERHVREALERLGWPLTPAAVLEGLAAPPEARPRRARVTDVVDQTLGPFRDRSCADAVVHAISQACLAWTGRGGAAGLYRDWRGRAARDQTPALALGIGGLTRAFAALPADPREAIHEGLIALEVEEDALEPYLVSLLLDVGGWASACAWRRFGAQQRGDDDPAVLELLAVRLSWEAALLAGGGAPVAAAWREARARWPAIDAQADRATRIDQVAQAAFEIATHEALSRRLAAQVPAEAPDEIAFQVVCCIDVRSEPLRRAIEAADAGAQTLGFAGFFGLPAEYHPIGATEGRPQLPGPLAPQVRVADTDASGRVGARRASRLTLRAALARFAADPLSTFAFVDAAGLAFGPRLLSDAFGLTRPAPPVDDAGLRRGERAALRPRLVGDRDGGPLSLPARLDLAERILRAAGLARPAPLVALVAHASSNVNNAHAAALDCGACCGHSGAVNARAVAALLNAPELREGLRERAIDLGNTCFVAALHDTTTDEVSLLEADLVPDSHRAALERLRAALATAGAQTRRARAQRMGLDADGPALLRALRQRARDWGQVRPEWGLAGNRALVIAPRARTRDLDLAGQVFLHEYRWRDDEDGAILALLLTAPMVVAHWINFQYFTSTVDPARWGSGDKLLHDVVAGGLGVFEGDGGDLRVGLPWQSVHDGRALLHEPIALGVFVEAPRAALERVIQAHPRVRELVDGGWVALHRIDDTGRVEARVQGGWRRIASGGGAAQVHVLGARAEGERPGPGGTRRRVGDPLGEG